MTDITITPIPVQVRDDEGQQRITVHGRLDVRTIADARQGLHAAIDAGQGPLVVDMADAEIGDAPAVGLLLEASRRARRRGRAMSLVGVDERGRRVLVRGRLDRVLGLARSTREAALIA
ncbi:MULTISPECIES: STAS domain-containing protein [unclassified Janibacter]|uniref:STAS domain-containing protein n=1 Tax=unclassified Janibacter TaxID=2649294 RepID=UPI003D02BF0F